MATRVVLKNVRVSYPNVFKPRASEEGKEPKYSMCCVLKRDDKFYAENKAKIDAAIDELLQEVGAKYKLPKDPKTGKYKPTAAFKLPVRDGDEKTGDELYEGADFINASSKSKPGLVDLALKPISEESEEFYAGCYARVSINFYAFDTGTAKGIAAGLENIQKTRDGECLAGKRSAADDFADMSADDLDVDDDLLLGGK